VASSEWSVPLHSLAPTSKNLQPAPMPSKLLSIMLSPKSAWKTVARAEQAWVGSEGRKK